LELGPTAAVCFVEDGVAKDDLSGSHGV
jgi:hypothetical protein